MINLAGYIVLPPAGANNFQIRNIQRFEKSDKDRQRYSRFDHRVF